MTNLVAILIVTNVVRVTCPCGWCNYRLGIAIPEHMNRIGYDLKEVVTTNYLPVVIRKSASDAKGDK